MPRGGRRAGAGRKAGGASRKSRAIADRAAAEGLTPLEFMLRIMRDGACPQGADAAQTIAFHTLRFDAAKAAAPYLHPRLSQRDEPVKMEALSGSLAEQGTQVFSAITGGRITPSQGATIMQVLAAQASIAKVDDFERRLKALEEKQTNAIDKP